MRGLTEIQLVNAEHNVGRNAIRSDRVLRESQMTQILVESLPILGDYVDALNLGSDAYHNEIRRAEIGY